MRGYRLPLTSPEANAALLLLVKRYLEYAGFLVLEAGKIHSTRCTSLLILLGKDLTAILWQFAFAYDAGTAVYSLLERDSKGEPTRRRLWVCCRRKTNTIPPKNQYRLKKNRPEQDKVCKDDTSGIYETGWVDEKDLELF